MFGFYRYLLAHMVILSHMWRELNYWAGAYAVFGFYMLSGYLMSFVLNEVYGNGFTGRINFLTNRALRIYPMYLLVLVVSICVVLLAPELSSQVNSALVLPFNITEWLHNIFIIGLNGEKARLVPVAWSLDVELTFYVLMALCLARNRYVVYVWLGLSVAYTLYMIWAGYVWRDRYFSAAAASLPFSIGATIFMVRARISGHGYWHAVAAAILFILNLAYADLLWDDPKVGGFYLSLGIGIYLLVSLIGLSEKNIPKILKSADKVCGDLAYPIFLCHWPVAVLVVLFGFAAEKPEGWELFLACALITNVVAFVFHYLVEERVNKLRYRIRESGIWSLGIMGRNTNENVCSCSSSQCMDNSEKVIFVCVSIDDNVNSTRFQRAKLLSSHFQTAILYRNHIPQEIAHGCVATYKVSRGLSGFIVAMYLLGYLRISKGFRTIHTQYSLYAVIWGFFAQKLFGYQWIYDLWDHPSLAVSKKKRNRDTFVMNTVLNVMLPSADAWIVGMSEGIMQFLPRPRSRTKIIKSSNGVSSTIFTVSGEEDCFPGAERSAQQRVCYFGWVTLERGLALLLNSLQSGENRMISGVNLFGWTNQEALAAINAHNARHDVKARYVGVLSHREALRKMTACDVCLCLLDDSVINYRYAYPIKLFEYLAMGKIVVATRTEGICEIISDGKNGFLVANNAESLQDAFVRIERARLDGSLARIKEEARRTAHQYSWEKVNKKLLEGLRADVMS